MKKQKILAYEGRIPVSDRALTAAVIDINNKKHLIIDLWAMCRNRGNYLLYVQAGYDSTAAKSCISNSNRN